MHEASAENINKRTIIGLLLAAGKSTRFVDAQGKPSDKLQALVTVNAVKQTVLEHSASALLSACPRSIAIIKRESAQVAQLQSMGMQTVIAHRADEGMGHSLAAGAQAAIAQGASAVVVMLADMPMIQSTTIEKVVAALQGGAQIVQPRFQSQQGHPVGFAAAYLPELAALTGDAGAKLVLKQHADKITYLDVIDEGIVSDIDTSDGITKY